MALRTVTPAIKRTSFATLRGASDRFVTNPASLQELYVLAEKTLEGKTNNTAEVTLTTSATTTTFSDPRILPTSVVLWHATTANAATLPITYAVAGLGSVVLHHASDAATDRTFRIAVFA